MTDRAVPNLPSRDFDATVAFYGGFGFEPEYCHDDWLILRRGELRLEFFPFPDLVPEESSFMCSIRVDDVDELYRQIERAGVVESSVGSSVENSAVGSVGSSVESSVGIPRLLPVRLQPWGQRAGFLVDLDGTQLHLIENIA